MHFRNPYVLDRGDVYLRCVLFFSLFLPLSDHLSVDAGVKHWLALQRNKALNRSAKSYLSVTTIAFLIQILAIYFFGSFAKGDEWRQGTAVEIVLSHKYYRAPIGGLLLHFPSLLSLITFFFRKWEFWCVFLLFVPVERFRMYVALAIISMHLLFVACLR